MEEKTTKGLKEQRERRKRINCMKMGIITSIFVWMLISIILCVVLLCRVISLQNQIDRLVSSGIVSGQVQQDENQSKGEMSTGTELQTDTEYQDQNADSSIVQSLVAEDESNKAQPGDQLKVYLTFDDGPSSNTAAILDTLAQYNVKATFFVVGKEDEESQEMYKRIVNEGHTLGMHSYSHKYSVIYDSLENFEDDFTKIQNYLYDITGEDCHYYRFPGGSSNQISNVPMSDFIHYLNEQGVIYYDWNVSAGDAASNAYSSEEIVANVMDDVVKYKTSVVLLHDGTDKSATVEALGPLIEALEGMGAQILPIDEDTQVIQYVKADTVE